MQRHVRLCYPLLYPLLFAAAPVLGITMHNTGRSSDLAVLLTAVVLATALALAIVFVPLRAFDRSEANFTATAALLTVVANRFERQRHGCVAVITSVAGDRGRVRECASSRSSPASSIPR